MDPIADMFCQIKNGLSARLETVDVPHSRTKEGLAQIMVKEGWLNKAEVFKRLNKQQLRISLKYRTDNQGVIANIKRVSTSGRRVYQTKDKIRRFRGGFGTVIISTSQGLMTDDQARAKGIGGEIICQIW